MKKNKKKLNITLIVTLGVLLVIGLFFGASLYRDKQKFLQASKEANIIANYLNKNSIAKNQQYCIYNNLKYSKGKLSCVVMLSWVLDGSFHDKIVDATQSAGWIFKGNNDKALNDSETTYTIANLYSNGKLGCFARERIIDSKHSKIEIGCSGPAKAEWFPVKKD